MIKRSRNNLQKYGILIVLLYVYKTVIYVPNPILSVIFGANLICLLFGRDSYNEIRVMMIYLHEMVWHSICQNNLNLYQRNLFRWITPMLDTKWGKYTSCFSQILDVLFPLFIPLDQSKKVSSWTPWGASIKTFIQLNKYETTPYFFLLNQNFTCPLFVDFCIFI